MKPRLIERPAVVPPGGVKDSALAVSSDPRPRFASIAFRLITFGAVLQHRAVRLVVQMMNVGLVPAREAAVPLHDRMSRLGYLSRKDLPAMPLKLRTHQRNDVFVISPAIGRAVQRNKSLAASDIVQHRFRLSIFDAIDISVQNQPVELRQRLRSEIFHLVRILQLDAAICERWSEFLKPRFRTMMPVVAHEQQREVRRPGTIAAEDCRHEQQKQHPEPADKSHSRSTLRSSNRTDS